MEGVVSRKHTQKLLRLLLEIVERTAILIYLALQLFYDGKTILGGDFLPNLTTTQRAQGGIAPEVLYCIQARLQLS